MKVKNTIQTLFSRKNIFGTILILIIIGLIAFLLSTCGDFPKLIGTFTITSKVETIQIHTSQSSYDQIYLSGNPLSSFGWGSNTTPILIDKDNNHFLVGHTYFINVEKWSNGFASFYKVANYEETK